jgi:hypothetical protein
MCGQTKAGTCRYMLEPLTLCRRFSQRTWCLATEKKRCDETLKDRLRSAVLPPRSQVDCRLQPCAYERLLRPQQEAVRPRQSVHSRYCSCERDGLFSLVFRCPNVARHCRVFRAELLGCGRERASPSNGEKISQIVPILTCPLFPIACCSLTPNHWEYVALHRSKKK